MQRVCDESGRGDRALRVRGALKNEGFLAARLHVDEAWSRLRGSLLTGFGIRDGCWRELRVETSSSDVAGGQARQMQSSIEVLGTSY